MTDTRHKINRQSIKSRDPYSLSDFSVKWMGREYMHTRDDRLVDWLFENGGPIIRYRTATQLMDSPAGLDCDRLFRDVLETPEVCGWLQNLANSRHIHGSQDTDAENSLGKLLEFGLRRGVPQLDEAVRLLLKDFQLAFNPHVLTPFLLRGGYSAEPLVADWFAARLEKLFATARRGRFDFYLDESETARVPTAWRGKPVYKDEYGDASDYALPTCFDFYSLAYHTPPSGKKDVTEKLETIVAFLSDPRFQSTPGGYGWNHAKMRCYAAGRVFLACTEPSRLVLFFEPGARFASARSSPWFRQGLDQLESFRTAQGTYRFPQDLLREKRNSYYLYGGAHMGLGEDRRRPDALELELTFRMLKIKKLEAVHEPG